SALVRAEKVGKGEAAPGLPTDLDALDDLLGPLEDRMLYVLGGRPSMGKTALAERMAINAARRFKAELDAGSPKRGVATFRLDMTKEKGARRAPAAEASIDLKAMKAGQLTSDEWRKALEAEAEFKSLPIHIDDAGKITVATMRSRARRLARKHGLGLILVDH